MKQMIKSNKMFRIEKAAIWENKQIGWNIAKKTKELR